MGQQTVWVSQHPQGLHVVIREGEIVAEHLHEQISSVYTPRPAKGRIVKSYVLAAAPVVLA